MSAKKIKKEPRHMVFPLKSQGNIPARAISSLGCRGASSVAIRLALAEISNKFMTQIDVSRGLAYIFGSGGMIYGWNEKRLRRSTTKRLAPERIKYEQEMDPERSSSGLPPSGVIRRDGV